MTQAAWSEISDEELARRAAAQSMPAFVVLVSRYEGRVYNFVLRRVRIAADAEDLTQETFLNAWRHVARYQPARRFSTWIFTIASRLTIDHLRLRVTHRKKLQNCAVAEKPRSSDSARDQGAADDDLKREGAALWTVAAEVLTDEQHAALWLRYAEDLSMKEIACVLGRTSISVRVMLHRARQLVESRAVESHSVRKDKAAPAKRCPVEVELNGGVACPTH